MAAATFPLALDRSESLRSRSSLLDPMYEVAVGTCVRVLPGRQFATFGSGDIGVVHAIDWDSQKCEVVFSGQEDAGPVLVALRHIRIEDADTAAGGSARGDVEFRAMSWASGGAFTPPTSPSLERTAMSGHAAGGGGTGGDSLSEDLSAKVRALDARGALQHRALAALEARLAACEAAAAVCEPAASGRLMAARVAALEGTHQAEIADLRRSLDSALQLGREQEQQLQKRQRASARELQQQVEEAERRALGLREAARVAVERLDKIDGALGGQEQRAAHLEEAVRAAGAGLSQLASLMEGHERKTMDLGQAISSNMEAQARCETRNDTLRSSSDLEGSVADAQRVAREREDAPLWQALREVQELVVHESEHRAAGLREVLGVFSQGIEQLRDEHGRQVADFEEKSRAECRRAKQRLTESQSRYTEHEKRADSQDSRIDSLSRALAAERSVRAEAIARLEEQVREARCEQSLRCLRGQPGVDSATAPSNYTTLLAGYPAASDVTTEMVTSQSIHRLEALEGRFDRGSRTPGASPGDREHVFGSAGAVTPRRLIMGDRAAPAAEGTLGRLRGQLEGLRSELAASAGVEGAVQSPRPAQRFPAQQQDLAFQAAYALAPGAAGAASPATPSLPARPMQNLEAWARSPTPPPTVVTITPQAWVGSTAMPQVLSPQAWGFDLYATATVPAELPAMAMTPPRRAGTGGCPNRGISMDGGLSLTSSLPALPTHSLDAAQPGAAATGARRDSPGANPRSPEVAADTSRQDASVAGPDTNQHGSPDVLPHTQVMPRAMAATAPAVAPAPAPAQQMLFAAAPGGTPRSAWSPSPRQLSFAGMGTGGVALAVGPAKVFADARAGPPPFQASSPTAAARPACQEPVALSSAPAGGGKTSSAESTADLAW